MKNREILGLIVLILIGSFTKIIAGGNYHFKNIPSGLVFPKDSLVKSDSDSVKEKERSYTLELDYGSNQTYKGRKSNVKQPYYSPSFNYEAPSGFFIYTSITNVIGSKSDTANDIVQARAHPIDEFLVNPGYDFKIGKKTDASIGVSLYKFYDTAMINYGVNANLEYSMDHDFNWINGKIIFDFDKGRSPTPNDFMISLEIYHSFDIEPLFGKGDQLSIKPDFLITTGTQNFYTRKNFNTPLSRTNIKRNSNYTILSYDFSLPISYSIGKFTFEPAMNYSIPVNQPANQPQTKPYGYLTIALIWDF
jgi:hypothetical protein